jgi:hypothetical protein
MRYAPEVFQRRFHWEVSAGFPAFSAGEKREGLPLLQIFFHILDGLAAYADTAGDVRFGIRPSEV